MAKLSPVIVLYALVVTQAPAIYSQSSFRSAMSSDVRPADAGDIPRLPPGKTTIFGGAIRNFDPVRDQFTLNVVGQRPMRILFDERTRVFRDGSKIKLRDLGPEQHASVETTLDGDKVFAVSIHLLSEYGAGQYDGRVVSYNPSTGVLLIDASASREPFKVFVSANTQFSRTGQHDFASLASGPSDLAPGSLVSIKFQARTPGKAVASAITVLAVPGSSFAFSGNIASIDLHYGSMILIDPSDQKSYKIMFNPVLFPEGRTLHAGDHVMVTAAFNGTAFVASAIASN
jgi:hypothetical protein